MKSGKNKNLFRIRLLTSVFIFCLVVCGITAFPLVLETGLLVRWFGETTYMGKIFPELSSWLTFIHEGIRHSEEHYPFMAYGTDWLAFAHIAVAVFFIGVVIDPVRNIWVVKAGMVACILVPVLAFTCGPIRGIPVIWCILDSSFGILGLVPLVFICRWAKQLEKEGRMTS